MPAQRTMIAGLPMYDFPELYTVVDAWWSGLVRAFRAEGVQGMPDQLDHGSSIDALWGAPDLALAQACGLQLMGEWAGRLEYLGTPCYAAPGCEGPNYCSWVVVRADSLVGGLEDLRGSRCVINSRGSHSGCNALRALVAPLARDGRFFGSVRVSGSHPESLAQLQSGLGDVAAIDCVTYALLGRCRPQATAETRILARTRSAPSLPYVTRSGTSPNLIYGLRAGLFRALRDPKLAEVREALLLAGFEVLPLASHGCTLEMVAEAARYRYRELDS